MAPVSQLGLVVLATASVAAASGHRGAHGKYHKRQSRYSPVAPFGYGNGTATAGPTGTGISNSTRTTTNIQTQTVYNTLTLPGTGSGSNTNVPVGGASASQCGGTVYATVTDTVTVTAGAGGETGYGSSSPAAPATSSAAPATPSASPATSSAAPAAPSSSASPETSSGAAPTLPAPSPIDSSAAEYPATETTFTARSVAPSQNTKAAQAPSKPSAPAAYSPPASSASASSPSQSSSSASSPSGKIPTKRGCLYKDGNSDACQAMAKTGKVSWSTNWASNPMKQVDDCQYVPQLWGVRPTEDLAHFTDDANKAIKAGASAILGYNEPDRSDQSGIDAKTTGKDMWNKYVAPFKGKVTLVSPSGTSTTSGSSTKGVQWLKDFKGAGATDWDATGIHFYANCANQNLGLENNGELSYMKAMIDDASSTFGKPVWVTEFGCNDGTPTNQIEAFMKVAVPYLEGEGKVAHYAPYMAQLLGSSSGLNSAGQAYVAPSGN